MLDRVRSALHDVMTRPNGDSLALVRLPKDLARRLNVTLGRPLASLEELKKRAAAKEKLRQLRAAGAAAQASRTEAAPILVYFEKDRNVRELTRIEELLAARDFGWKRLDLTGDEATLEFVTRKAQCEADDLPVVFVADRVIGGYEALVRDDVSGELRRLVLGR